MGNVDEELTNQTDDKDVVKTEGEDEKKKFKRAVIALLVKLLVIALCAYVFFFTVFGVRFAQNSDMSPAIRQGDLLLFYRLGNSYNVGDVVIYEIDGVQYVNRVVAIAGDTISFNNDGFITINGYAQQEDIHYETYVEWEDAGVEYELKVGEMFLLGDYRTECVDSRTHGTINCDDVLGNVITVIRKRNI